MYRKTKLVCSKIHIPDQYLMDQKAVRRQPGQPQKRLCGKQPGNHPLADGEQPDQQHYKEELSVPQIADVVGLNPVYLSRLFKLDTGKTLSEYLNCYRTECSLALLTDTADTIQSISQKVGYSDVRSYIRFFKKYYDVTPSEYRRGAVGK